MYELDRAAYLILLDSVDSIQPTSIVHDVDIVIIDDEPEQLYNFIDYHFEDEGAYCRGRHYLDEEGCIVLTDVFDDRLFSNKVENAAFFLKVVQYCQRRYQNIDANEDNRLIWKAPKIWKSQEN